MNLSAISPGAFIRNHAAKMKPQVSSSGSRHETYPVLALGNALELGMFAFLARSAPSGRF